MTELLIYQPLKHAVCFSPLDPKFLMLYAYWFYLVNGLLNCTLSMHRVAHLCYRNCNLKKFDHLVLRPFSVEITSVRQTETENSRSVKGKSASNGHTIFSFVLCPVLAGDASPLLTNFLAMKL